MLTLGHEMQMIIDLDNLRSDYEDLRQENKELRIEIHELLERISNLGWSLEYERNR